MHLCVLVLIPVWVLCANVYLRYVCGIHVLYRCTSFFHTHQRQVGSSSRARQTFPHRSQKFVDPANRCNRPPLEFFTTPLAVSFTRLVSSCEVVSVVKEHLNTGDRLGKKERPQRTQSSDSVNT